MMYELKIQFLNIFIKKICGFQGTGDESGLPDARAQVGFLSTEGKMHTLPGSATEQVRNLEKLVYEKTESNDYITQNIIIQFQMV